MENINYFVKIEIDEAAHLSKLKVHVDVKLL